MDADIERLLNGFPVYISLPIQWGDQDAFGHVNNTVYLRWFESARIAYGNKVGLAQISAAQKIGPILAAVACNYRKQLTFPDTVHIGARITRIGRSSMVMEHRVVSDGLQAIAADGDSTVVMFDYAANKSIPVPDAVHTAINSLEGKPIGSA